MKHYAKNNYLYVIVCLLFSIFSFWLAYQIPYTHDDWDWGLEIGMQQLLTAKLNSRYVGNFLEVVMTRSQILKTIILGSTYALIPCCITSITCKSLNKNTSRFKISVFLLSIFLLHSMNPNTFQQTYGWIAGFANFVISVLPLSLLIYESVDLLDTSLHKKKTSALKPFVLFVVAIAAQLFIENLTFYLVLFTASSCVICYWRTRSIHHKYIAMFIGSVIGALIMFSSSIYGTLFTTGSAVDGYRELTVGAHHGFITSIFLLAKQGAILVKKIWFNNYLICIVIILLISILVPKNNEIKPTTKRKLLFCNFLTIGLYIAGAIVQENADPQNLLANIFYALNSAIFFILVSAEIILLFKKNNNKLLPALFYWLSAPLIIAPLVFTNVAGYRLFFSSNFFLILFAQLLLVECLETISVEKGKILSATIIFTTAILICSHIHIFSAIGNCSAERSALIDEMHRTDAKELTLPDFPYSQYLWLPNPANEERMVYFKEFYGIPSDVEVIINTLE